MRNLRSEIAEMKAYLEGELRAMNAEDRSLSTKVTRDESSEFDERKYCISSILTHIASLADAKKDNAEYKTSISAIKECVSVYNRSKDESASYRNAVYEKANKQIRAIIFSDLEGEYVAKAEKQFSASAHLKSKSAGTATTPLRRMSVFGNKTSTASSPALLPKSEIDILKERIKIIEKSMQSIFEKEGGANVQDLQALKSYGRELEIQEKKLAEKLAEIPGPQKSPRGPK